MKKVGIAILGLGVVGGGTYKILTEHNEFYKKNYSVDLTVEAVLERDRQRAKDLGVDENKIVSNMAEICSNSEIDIVVEVIGGIEPAKTFVLAALNSGKSVVTSNKELYCKYSHELEKVAKKNNCGLYFEACCVGGVPVIDVLTNNLQANKITTLMGIINGTTNYILTKMSEGGAAYSEVLKEAQDLGYAEADPTADVEGYDASYKLSILSSIAFHTKVPYTEIYREGISNIDATDIYYGKQLGYVMKLLAIGRNGDNGIEVRVHPTFVKSTHPLASVNDSYNAVYIIGDSVENVMLYGRGAGALPTGSAIVGDVIRCATTQGNNYSAFKNTEKADPSVKFVSNFESEYYVRFTAEDRAGVLSKITSLFSKHGISVSQVIQQKPENGKVPLLIVTHTTQENCVRKVVSDVAATAGIADVVSVIRVVS